MSRALSMFLFSCRYIVASMRGRRGRDVRAEGPRIAVVFVFPTVPGQSHIDQARRFVATYRQFPPMADHTLHVVFNGPEPSDEHHSVLSGLAYEPHQHDDSGWDIGAFQKASREVDCDLMVFLGGASHFKRAGWLKRMKDAFVEHGEALYGASASYERDPHIRSTAFWCRPEVVRSYPKTVRTYEERYEFEASPQSLTRLAEHVGLKCLLVTWDGVYARPDWRKAANIFRRGDQSNSIVRDRYFDLYDSADEQAKAACAALADTWVDRAPARWEAWRETGV